MKKLILVFLVLCSIIYIYIFTYDKNIYYFSISNNENNINEDKISNYLENLGILENYINDFNNYNNRIIDFSYMINSNKVLKINNKNISFKNALVKADIITITFFPDNDNFNNTYKSINYRNDLISFLNKIREYSKEDIFYLGINENIENKIVRSNIIKVNSEIKEYCKMQNIIYVDFTNKYYDSIIKQIRAITLNKKNK